jgi:hypothetical protein
MKFTPQAHLKSATIIDGKARAASGTRKLRLEGLAHAFRIRATQLEAKMKGMTTDSPSLVASSDLPLMTHLIDEPGLFDTLDAWEQHLTDLLSLPDSVSRRLSVQQAKAVIAKMRAAET